MHSTPRDACRTFISKCMPSLHSKPPDVGRGGGNQYVNNQKAARFHGHDCRCSSRSPDRNPQPTDTTQLSSAALSVGLPIHKHGCKCKGTQSTIYEPTAFQIIFCDLQPNGGHHSTWEIPTRVRSALACAMPFDFADIRVPLLRSLLRLMNALAYPNPYRL